MFETQLVFGPNKSRAYVMRGKNEWGAYLGVDLNSPVGVDVLLRVQSGPGEVITYVDAADMPRDHLCGLIRVRGEVVAMDTLLLYAVWSLLRWGRWGSCHWPTSGRLHPPQTHTEHPLIWWDLASPHLTAMWLNSAQFSWKTYSTFTVCCSLIEWNLARHQKQQWSTAANVKLLPFKKSEQERNWLFT